MWLSIDLKQKQRQRRQKGIFGIFSLLLCIHHDKQLKTMRRAGLTVEYEGMEDARGKRIDRKRNRLIEQKKKMETKKCSRSITSKSGERIFEQFIAPLWKSSRGNRSNGREQTGAPSSSAGLPRPGPPVGRGFLGGGKRGREDELNLKEMQSSRHTQKECHSAIAAATSALCSTGSPRRLIVCPSSRSFVYGSPRAP